MDIKRIHFEELKRYWIEVDHFKKPGKKIREVVRILGPFECTIDDPRRESYGLFDDGKIIGVTHLVQWGCPLVTLPHAQRAHTIQGPGPGLDAAAGRRRPGLAGLEGPRQVLVRLDTASPFVLVPRPRLHGNRRPVA